MFKHLQGARRLELDEHLMGLQVYEHTIMPRQQNEPASLACTFSPSLIADFDRLSYWY